MQGTPSCQLRWRWVADTNMRSEDISKFIRNLARVAPNYDKLTPAERQETNDDPCPREYPIGQGFYPLSEPESTCSGVLAKLGSVNGAILGESMRRRSDPPSRRSDARLKPMISRMRKRRLGRAFRWLEQDSARDRDSVAEGDGFELPRPFRLRWKEFSRVWGTMRPPKKASVLKRIYQPGFGSSLQSLWFPWFAMLARGVG
jgi:hypothetical protein